MLGQRATFGSVLTEMAPLHNDMMVVTADFTRSSGLERFSKLYADKYLTVGIAEQNLVGISSGLASEGYNVFATSFASFISTRCYEQIKIHAGYMGHNLKLVGLASGFGVEYQGNTHYGLDDICLMRNIPHLTIVAPADCCEVAKATEALCSFDGPVYLRLCGESNNPMVYKGDYDFEIGKAVPLCDGDDVAIYATGTMVFHSLKAAALLKESGISCSVINVHTIKPIDRDVVLQYSHKAKLAVTVEEGFYCGGLYAAVTECLDHNCKRISTLPVGLGTFPHAGSYKYMLKQCGLDAESIAERIANKLNSL